MKLLFKLKVTETNKNTIGEINFKSHFSAVNKSTAWNTLKPFIKNATRTYVIPYIGAKFYDKIQTDYEADNSDPIGDEVMKCGNAEMERIFMSLVVRVLGDCRLEYKKDLQVRDR